MRFKRLVFPIIICILVMTLCSCSKAPSSVTLLIYMCGSDLESKTGIASENLNEILSADIPDNVKVIIETGGSNKWLSNNIPSDKIMRYEVKDHKLQEIARLDDACMGSANTLRDFVEFGTTTYPSDNTMLLLWDHGGGTVKGACFDEKYNNDTLTIPEMKEALEGGLKDKRLSVVGFDACLMADYEVAEALSNYADMLIASQNYEVGLGWDYSKIAQSLSKKTGKDLAKDICDDYMDKCTEASKESTATMSAVDLSDFSKITDAFNSMLNDLIQDMDDRDGRMALRVAIKNSASFGANSSGKMDNFVDLRGVACELAGHDIRNLSGQEYSSKSAEALDKAIGDAVIYEVSGEVKDNATGMSIYYPTHYNMDEIQEYLKICPSETYKKLIESIFNDIPKTTIAFSNAGYTGNDGKFHVAFTPESAKYILNVSYTIYKKNDDGSEGEAIITNYIDDKDIDFAGLDFAVDYDGTYFALDNHPIMATQVDHSDKADIYMSKITRNGVPESFRFAYVDDLLGSHLAQIGMVPYNDDVGASGRDVFPILPGDVIEVGSQSFTVDAKGPIVTCDELTDESYIVKVTARDMFDKEIVSNSTIMYNSKNSK